MSTSLKFFGDTSKWWEQLGLRHTGVLLASKHERSIGTDVMEVLQQHPPVAFASGTEGQTLTLEEVVTLVRQAAARAEHEGERQRELAAEERRRFGWEQVERALTGPDSDEVVTEGRWTGFTRGEATAWCWNLFQYEARGFIQPGAQMRVEAVQKLQAGVLPEVFGYPERARALADRGLTPREYRHHKEALGANTFTPADIQHR